MKIRSEVKEQIESSFTNDQLEVIIVSSANEKKNLYWTREGKEFVYKNKLYDVIRKNETNDKVTYYCLNDKKEEELFADLDDYVRKNSKNDQNIKNILSKILNNYFFENLKSEKATISCEIISLQVTNQYKNPEIKVTSPPPNFS